MSKRAYEYVAAKREPGWFTRYALRFNGGRVDYAWLCGHLEGVLFDIEKAVGRDRLLRLLVLSAELQAHEETIREECGG